MSGPELEDALLLYRDVLEPVQEMSVHAASEYGVELSVLASVARHAAEIATYEAMGLQDTVDEHLTSLGWLYDRAGDNADVLRFFSREVQRIIKSDSKMFEGQHGGRIRLPDRFPKITESHRAEATEREEEQRTAFWAGTLVTKQEAEATVEIDPTVSEIIEDFPSAIPEINRVVDAARAYETPKEALITTLKYVAHMVRDRNNGQDEKSMFMYERLVDYIREHGETNFIVLHVASRLMAESIKCAPQLMKEAGTHSYVGNRPALEERSVIVDERRAFDGGAFDRLVADFYTGTLLQADYPWV